MFPSFESLTSFNIPTVGIKICEVTEELAEETVAVEDIGDKAVVGVVPLLAETKMTYQIQ